MKLQTGMAETFASSETAADTQRRFLRSCANTWPLNDGYGPLARRLAVIMHRMWVDGTEFRWTREVAAA
jgi:hypothetical protein